MRSSRARAVGLVEIVTRARHVLTSAAGAAVGSSTAASDSSKRADSPVHPEGAFQLVDAPAITESPSPTASR